MLNLKRLQSERKKELAIIKKYFSDKMESKLEVCDKVPEKLQNTWKLN